MKADVEVDARILRRIMSGGPTVSVYFNRAASPVGRPAKRRLEALLADQEVDSSTGEMLTCGLLGSRADAAALAAFVSAGDPAATVVEMPGAHLPDSLICAPFPHVRPLVAWLQERPPYVLVMADREGADMEIHPGGIQKVVTRSITGPDGGRGSAGRGSTKRHGRTEVNPRERTALRVADALCDELLCSPMELLLLAGDIRVLHDLDKHLPGGLRRRVSIWPVPCDVTLDDRGRRRAPRVEQQIRAWVTARNARLLSRIAEEGNAADWVVEGAPKTLEALSRGRVRILMIVDEPRDRRVAWFDRASAQAALSKDALTRSGALVGDAPLIDVALRAALLTGADVRLVPPGTPNAPAQGIGALCRFGG